VNPLTWRHDEAPAPASQNRGAVFFEQGGAPAPRPGFASARCIDGTLQVELTGAPPRDFMSRLLDRAMGDGNYHPIEVGLFFVDLRENAIERVRAFRLEGASGASLAARRRLATRESGSALH